MQLKNMSRYMLKERLRRIYQEVNYVLHSLADEKQQTNPSPDKRLGPVIQSPTAEKKKSQYPDQSQGQATEGSSTVLPLSACQSLSDIAQAAALTLTPKAKAYYTSGAESHTSLLRNQSDWSLVSFRPRVLRNVSKVSMNCRIMGLQSSLPIFIAPAAAARLGHVDGEKCLTRGAARMGVPQCVSTYSSVAPKDLTECFQAETAGRGGGMVFQLYVPKVKKDAEGLILKAKELGFDALAVTVDAPVIGKRDVDDRFKALLDYEAGVVAQDSVTHPPFPGEEAETLRGHHCSSFEWNDIPWIRGLWGDQPIILKGIQTWEDALEATKYGVDGIYLSNHGGRQLDHAPSSVRVLRDIRSHCPEVFKSFDIYVDGGVMRGTDVAKALCLGARAVGIGRGFMYALSAYGTEGVLKAISILSDEIQTTMRLLGGDALESAGLKVLRQGTAAYKARDESYFSVSAQLSPGFIVQPLSAAEVSLTVTKLKSMGCNWAIRGGGHATWAGASNIADGVTIDMGLIKEVQYSPDLKIASIGAGALWRDVYSSLEPYGVTAPGGRTSTVGVAGFLTGGGNNFFSAEVGLGCDNVVNFEVVLASGKIVNANRETNSDLHKALKGGSSNFGIVTRIDMQTVDVVEIWGGQIVYPLSTTEQHIAAYVKWVDNIPNYTKGSAVTFWAYSPSAGTVVSTAVHDTANTEWAPAYDDFRNIQPQTMNTLRHDSHLNMTVELEEPTGYRQVWLTLTGKNDARFIRRAVEAQSKFIENWKNTQDADFLNYITFQAMPALLFRHSVEKGGNVIGMDREKCNAILFQMQHMVRSADAEKEARGQLVALRKELKDYSVAEGIDVEWEYLGYADSNQDPLSTYGPENIKLLKEVAAKYDPEQVFQKRVPGGFKISKVA
ncbi:(S)-mandelate dehydrogenase [Colletotrichum fructicola]|nr:(S)-mandelate dehydrogenase [Colletotrichum fructicola]KAF4939447.1 (S)-mandelate dehydrogenase [Colletotrichum fructicola]